VVRSEHRAALVYAIIYNIEVVVLFSVELAGACTVQPKAGFIPWETYACRLGASVFSVAWSIFDRNPRRNMRTAAAYIR